jgi:predicted transcriptional regulator
VNPETVNGTPVSDEQIEAWAAEAEVGYPVEVLRRRGRRPLGEGESAVVPVRMEPALLDALATRAKREHVTRSEAIRAAVRAWIDVA